VSFQNSTIADDNTEIKTLIQQLGSSDYQERNQATQSLIKLNKQAIAALKTAVFEENFETRYRSLQVLKYQFYNGDQETSEAAKQAISEISFSSPEFINDAFSILRKPSEDWLKTKGKNIRYNSINLNGVKLQDEDLQNIRYLSNITGLYLKETSITDKGVVYLKNLKSLKILDLSHNKITDKGIKVLSQLKKLEVLALKGTGISDESLQTISKLKNLRTLIINDTKVTEKGLKLLSKLKKLETLHLKNIPLKDADLEIFKTFKNLNEINLHGSHIKGLEVSTKILNDISKDVTQLTKHKANLLKAIYTIGQEKINNTIISNLKKTLNANKNLPTDELEKLIYDLGVIWLNIIQPGYNQKHFRTTYVNKANPLKRNQIKKLTLSGSKITDESLQNIEFFGDMEELHLKDEIKITDKGLQYIKKFSKLKRLTIHAPAITDEGIKILLKFRNLNSLDLSGTQITDTGLASFKNLHKLYTLRLNHTKITGKGFENFKGLHRHSTIYLLGCQIRNNDLQYFKKLKGPTFILDNKYITEKERHAFCKKTGVKIKLQSPRK